MEFHIGVKDPSFCSCILYQDGWEDDGQGYHDQVTARRGRGGSDYPLVMNGPIKIGDQFKPRVYAVNVDLTVEGSRNLPRNRHIT